MMTRWCLPYFGCPLMHRKVLASSRQQLNGGSHPESHNPLSRKTRYGSPVTRDEFNRYIGDIQQRWPAPFWVARSFGTADEWNRWSSLEFRARANNHQEAQLDHVLYHRHAVVLGEAGSGKSVVARKTIELTAQRGLIPIFLPLAAYSEDLPTLFRQHSSDEVLCATSIGGTPAPRPVLCQNSTLLK